MGLGGFLPWFRTTVPKHTIWQVHPLRTAIGPQSLGLQKSTQFWESETQGTQVRLGLKYIILLLFNWVELGLILVPHFLSVRSEDSLQKHFQSFVHLKHDHTFPIYELSARTHHICFPFVSVSHLFLLGILDLDVKGQRPAGCLISDTSSGDRKRAGKRRRKWQFFLPHLTAGFDQRQLTIQDGSTTIYYSLYLCHMCFITAPPT